MPEPPKIGKHHPRGVDIEILKTTIRSLENSISLVDFLSTYFEGVGKKSAEDFCKWAGFNPDTPISKLMLSDLERLARKMREYNKWRRPRSLTLSPLGSELLEEGVRNILEPEFVASVTRPPSSYGGHPFIVEAAVAYGGRIPVQNTPLLLRFANRMPLLYDEGVDVSRKVIDSIDWSIYKIKFPAPLAIVTHICSTKIPFKGVGKEAIADVPEVEHEIEIAIRDVARKLRTYLSKLEKMYEIKRREVTIKKYIDEVARALGYIVGNDSKELFRNKLLSLLNEDLRRRSIVRKGEEIGVTAKTASNS